MSGQWIDFLHPTLPNSFYGVREHPVRLRPKHRIPFIARKGPKRMLSYAIS